MGGEKYMKEFEQLIDQMDLETAMEVLATTVKKIFSQASEQSRLKFVYALTGDAGKRNAADLVHL
jgi:hypothetical protein